MTSYDPIIIRGALPINGTLTDEPALLVQSLTVTPAREKKTYKGATTKAIEGIQFTNPTLTFAFSCYIAEETGLTIAHPGSLVAELANFAGAMHGFDPADGIMIYEDPSRKLDLENPDALDFTVTQYPYCEAS
jgi:hypothetical protein